MTNNDKYKSALSSLKENKIHGNLTRYLSGEIINVFVLDYTLSRNKLMEDIRGIVGEKFKIDYLPIMGEIIIQLKKIKS